jgi:ABC-3C protein
MALEQHSAPGANAGYTYQFERALYWLAKSTAGAVIGIETSDDVAVKEQNGTLVLEQDKHSVRTDAKPFGDRSKDLWNTLAIWINALDSAEISAASTQFLMVTNKVLTDCIAKRISSAQSSEQVDTCIEGLEKVGKAPSELISKMVERVLRQDSRETLRSLIKKCEVIDAQNASDGTELRKSTVSQLQLPEWCSAQSDSIVNELSGWLQKLVLTLWREQRPAWIERDKFVNQLHAIINLRKRQLNRERAENLIPVSADKIGEQRSRPFVRQVFLVTEDEEIANTAIREFIRCNIEKMRLSEEGNVTDEDWRAFETTLESRWQKIFVRVLRMSKETSEEDVGFEIFTETTEGHRENLAGSSTEQVYLTSGTYHRLADVIRLGWHPRFKDLMSKPGELL